MQEILEFLKPLLDLSYRVFMEGELEATCGSPTYDIRFRIDAQRLTHERVKILIETLNNMKAYWWIESIGVIFMENGED